MAGRDADVMAVARVADAVDLPLEVVDMRDAAAAEEAFAERFAREVAFARIVAERAVSVIVERKEKSILRMKPVLQPKEKPGPRAFLNMAWSTTRPLPAMSFCGMEPQWKRMHLSGSSS